MERDVDRLNRNLGKPKSGDSQNSSADSNKENKDASKPKGFIRKWWDKKWADEKDDKNAEGKLWFMYAVTVAVGITTSVLVSSVSDKATGIAWAAIVVLLMLHIVVWPFYTKKTSAISKWVISGIIIFYPAAWLIPNFADGVYGVWRIAKIAGGDGSAKVVRIADNYENGMPLLEAISPPTKKSVHDSSTTAHFEVIAEEYTWATVPINTKLDSGFECPSEMMMAVDRPGWNREYVCGDKTPIALGTNGTLQIGFKLKQQGPPITMLVKFVPM